MKVIATCAPHGIGMPCADLSDERELTQGSARQCSRNRTEIGAAVEQALIRAREAGYDPFDEMFHVIVQFSGKPISVYQRKPGIYRSGDQEYILVNVTVGDESRRKLMYLPTEKSDGKTEVQTNDRHGGCR